MNFGKGKFGGAGRRGRRRRRGESRPGSPPASAAAAACPRLGSAAWRGQAAAGKRKLAERFAGEDFSLEPR